MHRESGRQPWLHEMLICTRGNATCVSTRDGGLGDSGTGLYVDDRRVLSRLRVRLAGEPVTAVAADAAGARAEFLGSARGLGDTGPDPTIEVHRSRCLRSADTATQMVENIIIRSRAAVDVRTRLEVELAGDCCAVHDVKSGLPTASLLPARPDRDARLTWRDDRHRVVLDCSTADGHAIPALHPGTIDSPSTVEIPVALEPGAALTVRLSFTVERLAPSAFDADAGAELVDWSRVRFDAADGRIPALVDKSLADLHSLLLRDPLDDTDVFAAAGSPWYLTLFGRDSLWTATMMLPFGTELAGGTLRALARRQGTVDDPRSAQQPGKILHEVRREVLRDAHQGLELPTTYYGSVDATALWVCLLHDAWRHGLPGERVQELLPNLVAALGWIIRSVEASPDGLLRYFDDTGHGLSNQGWKDSADALRRADGSLAEGSIALLEAQTYAVRAVTVAADLLEALGSLAVATADVDVPHPEALRTFASALAEGVRDRFWTADGLPAMALDGQGERVDGIGSNMGHALGTGCLTGSEAARVAAALTSPDLLGRYGISTLGRSNPGFNPLGYHTGSVWTHDTAICARGLAAEDFAAEAHTLVRALVETGAAFDHRWPELCSAEAVLGAPAPYPAACRPQAWSAGSAGVLVSVLLGLQIDVPGRWVRIRPVDGAGPLHVRGLVFGEAEFSVRVDAAGGVRVDGLPAEVEVRR